MIRGDPWLSLVVKSVAALDQRSAYKESKRDTTIKEVAVLEVLDQTAVAKVTAMWGIDYMLLGKYDGRWKIVQIRWQSHPPKGTT